MNIATIVAKYPDDAAAIEKLVTFFVEAKDDAGFDLAYLYEHAGFSTPEATVMSLLAMDQEDFVESWFSLELPPGVAVGRYHSVMDIPRDVFNPNTGEWHRVLVNDIRVYYRRRRAPAGP